MSLDAEYKKYVEHWGDPIDPINYKLYSMETNMPCFHPDNRLFTKEEFKEQLEKVSPQDPAVCNYPGLRPVEGYKEEEKDKEDIDKEIKIERGDIDFMYKWIRSKSGK